MKKINQNKLSNLKTSFYNFYKKRKVLTILTICLILAISSILTVNYGRYVKDIVTTYFFKTQNFFFNSNKLLYGGKEYVIEPWSGTEDVEIYVAMDSLENELNGATKDVLYSVVCDADSTVNCTIEGNATCPTGVDGVCREISAATNLDSYNIVISPKMNDGYLDAEKFNVIKRFKDKNGKLEEKILTNEYNGIFTILDDKEEQEKFENDILNMDLGIAKLHFELGVGDDTFLWA